MSELEDVDVVIAPIAKNRYDVSKKRGNWRGSIQLVEGKWNYHDFGVFKLDAQELIVIAYKLNELSMLKDVA